MVILGIDPGSRVTGFGVLEKGRYDLSEICHGEVVIRPGQSLSSFLAHLYETLREVVERTRPEAVAVEEVFYGKNVKSLITQGQVRGVAILAGSTGGLPVFEYSPLEVKKAVVGYGRAEKAQVQRMVKAILGLAEVPGRDAADALAVAICHAHTGGGPLGTGMERGLTAASGLRFLRGRG
ncbi:MAG TPA: crossover junction endodeoxyribonuclease RuvC [Syntrophales bacterium]|nr:crossover junction endodeoxyribonuclease RuvC [Syntrophales bacterium]HOM07945.1 crossover junction endodeoxyribonuclease RuvC [Syntrophales bacterium]HOO00657.1 crossover junction endodeoxyribonuclease RuvC [Syntrophales bacterium]HPC01911.1 crossover junction endodeoxyribonuclease RuvC [Syntrophales bacterium]HRS87807.1 crossover junction endodeoxyribonuclease RuvC [Syntrophales bacterium]